MSTYDWFPTFLLFGPPGSGKTEFTSWLYQRYQIPDAVMADVIDNDTGKKLGEKLEWDGKTYRPLKIEVADVGHGLFSWKIPPTADMIHEINDYEDCVNYLAGVEERDSDAVIIDDLSQLNYKITMESAQIRGGRDKDTQSDIKKMITSAKYGTLRFIPPQLRDRGIASEKLRILLYNLIDLKKILFITCGEKLEAEKISKGLGEDPIFTGATYREPNLPGNMPNELPYFVSEVLYVYRVAGAESLAHKIRYLPDGGMVSCTKDRSGKLQTLAGGKGVLEYDANGVLFDKIMDVLPWPEGRRPIRVT